MPLIALAQLSRAVEQRGGEKRPMLSDLRESGSIEQDADAVVFLWRAEYYKIEQDADGNSTANTILFDFAKHRNGAVGQVITGCTIKNGRFFELEALPNFAQVQRGGAMVKLGAVPATQFEIDDDVYESAF